MRVAPGATLPIWLRSAAGFMATSTLGASPGVVMSWSEMWTWNADTPARVPAGARISAGKSGNVARSLPYRALVVVNRSPVSCMPSPESPAKRMITRSTTSGARARCVVSVNRVPLDVLLTCPGPYRLATRQRRTVSDRDGADTERDHHPPDPGGSGDGDRSVEVDVLDGVEQLDALAHRALE